MRVFAWGLLCPGFMAVVRDSGIHWSLKDPEEVKDVFLSPAPMRCAL